MSVIDFSKADCKNCYKCVRSCPVKAIKVKHEQAGIVESLCIGCGQCLRVCPKNAKEVKSELQRVKNYINSGCKVAVSLAPAFAAAFDFKSHKQFISALKKLGFSYVQETAVAAHIVTKKYYEYYKRKDGKNYITTSCPAVNYLIQKYHPNLIENMIPVLSPMGYHAKMMKEEYSSEVKVVFIGPCLSKKMEAMEDENVDAVLTFDEVSKWFENTNINLDELEETEFDSPANVKAARMYPVNGGVVHTLDKVGKIESSSPNELLVSSLSDNEKSIFKVDGIENCLNLLKSMEKQQFENSFIEMNLCSNACINGPAMLENDENVYIRRNRIKKYVADCEKDEKNRASGQTCEPLKTEDSIVLNEKLYKRFNDLSVEIKMPSYSEIKKILESIGKKTSADELNCGTCGYNTCHDKAVAVYNGMAEKHMCLPYMRQRAETLSNIIFDVTPNIIIIMNEELEIVEFNPAAEAFFNITSEFAEGKPISLILEDADFRDAINIKNGIISKRIILENYDAIMLQTILYIKEQNVVLNIMNDITNEEKKEEEIKSLKIKTLDMAQEVIDKQMRVAQEIASLLGETTAETKVTLTKLKKLVQSEEGAGK